MGSSAPKTQTVVEKSNSEPWSGAQPALRQALSAAQTQFAAGMPSFFPGSTVAQMSQDTTDGLNTIRSNAGLSGTLANQQLGAVNSAMNPVQIAGTGTLQQTANGQNSNPFASFFSSQTNVANPFLGAVNANASQSTDVSRLNPFVTGSASNPMAGRFAEVAGAPITGDGMDTLGAAARGELMTNPYLDSMFDIGANKIRNQLDTAFARSGRSFGNDNYGDELSRGLGEYATTLYGQAYEGDMARRMAAAGQLAGYEQGSADRMLGALGAEADLGEAGLGRWFDAASSATGYGAQDLSRQLTASGMGADIFSNNRAQNLNAGQIGAGIFDQDLSRSIDSYLALAGQRNAETGMSLDAASMLPGIYDFAGQGARDLLGVGASLEAYDQANIDAARERWDYTQNAPRANIEWLNAIASGQGQLGGTSVTSGQRPYQASNPLMQGLGAMASIASIASMFGMSDRRLKEDARFIGEDDDGNRIWGFRYAWDRPEVERFGVMADEVDPAHVARHPSGFDMVNYGAVFA